MTTTAKSASKYTILYFNDGHWMSGWMAAIEFGGKRYAVPGQHNNGATCAYDTKEAAKRAAIRFAKHRVPQIIREASISPDDKIRKTARAIGTPFETFKANVLASAELRERFGLPALAA